MIISYIKSIFLVILTFSTPYILLAQDPEWVVYDTSNSSLPSNRVTSVSEDLDGNIWVGTYGGLVRISEYGWSIFTNSNSGLPSNGIQSIAVDSNNVKWIGMIDDGIVKYYDEVWEHYTTQNSNLPSNCVNQIIVDKNNKKWIASELGCGIGGVLVIDDTSWVTYTVENSELPVGTVSSIDVDDSLTAWIGMTYEIHPPLGGLAKFDGVNWEFYDYNTPGFSSGDIYCTEADKDTIWVGTSWGLSKYNRLEWITYLEENSDLPNNYVNTVLADSNGIKWIGVGRANFDRKGALVKYFNDSFIVFDTTNSPILPGYVTAVFVDSYKNKWIAIRPYWDQSTLTSYGGGLAIYNENGVIVNIDEKDQNSIVREFSLANNYPNPFNPITTINYSIPKSGIVKLQIFDTLGKSIATLVNEYQTSGKYKVIFDGSRLVSGVYIYSLSFGKYFISKKMLMIK